MRLELLFALSCLTAAAADPPPVIAHWPLDELAQGQAGDTGPQGLTASLTGGPAPQSIAGQRAGALRFAAGEAALVVQRQPILDLQPPFTIALWMRPEQRGVAMELLCRAQDSGQDGWRLRTGWGQVTFQIPAADGPGSVGVPPRTVAEDHWVHVAVTADGQTLRLYLNAEPVAEQPCQVAPRPSRVFVKRPSPPAPPGAVSATAPVPPLPPVAPQGSASTVVFGGAQFVAVGRELAEALGVERGLLVVGAGRGSPAEQSGLRPGDVVIAVEGRSIASPLVFLQAVEQSEGRELRLRLMRRGKPAAITLRW